jgi:MFS family permease
MDQMGAVAGPLLGLVLLGWLSGNYRQLSLLAFLPAVAGVALLLFTRETARPREAALRTPLKWRSTPSAFRRYLLAWGVFAIGNSSDVFLLLRAQQLGARDRDVILLFALFNAATVVAAWPSGAWSDRVPRRRIVAWGFVAFGIAYCGFALSPHVRWLWWLFPLHGVYAGLAEGAARAMVVDLVPAEWKGAALGWHGAVAGLLTLAASLIAGALWQVIGPAAPFWFGGACALAAAALVTTIVPKPAQSI